MRTAIFVTVLLASLVSVFSDECRNGHDCELHSQTLCIEHNHLVCQLLNNTDSSFHGHGICTCAHDQLTCATRENCEEPHNYQVHPCMIGEYKHCYDGKCICNVWGLLNIG